MRNIRKMTQEQVADVIGISRQSYAKWERGV
ncbi:helix-turn-helix transcriptional regulator [uncultured Clostridium sp.]